ncbi:hypothetical protein AC1031_003631 [Aphanomyces cochlioides]|nr:hypothetical protein AC1031_003631 [Aphanomyces cochlioides]
MTNLEPTCCFGKGCCCIGQFVYDFLNKVSDENLKTLSNIIDVTGVKAIPIGGAFLIPDGTKDIVSKLSASSAVTYLDLNSVDFSKPEVLKNAKEVAREAATNEWSVETVGAPSIWKYYNGSGAVVGSIDTGALYTHEAIKGNWRSELGWFDPYNSTALPWDSDGHGSHTIGTMVGSNGIGVAPGAKWISCTGLYEGSDDSTHLLHWGAKTFNPWMEDAVAAWKAAGTIPVFSNGNNGPVCGSVGNPGGYNTVIGVGAIGSYDSEPNLLAYFSSKGPQTANGPAYIKPDVSAPGFWTRSVDITTNSTKSTST